MFAAQAFDAPAADLAFGAGACFVIPVARINTRKIKVVFEQVMHGVREAARQQLLLQIDHEKLRAQINHLVPRDESPPNPIAIRSLILHSVHGTMQL